VQIEQQVYNYPWSEGIFKDCFTAGYKCWVCEDMEKVVAYSILSLAAGEAHIMNICVDPAEQKQGIGKTMIEKLIEEVRDRKINSLFLEVRPSNTAAIALYEKLGFNELGLRKNYYPAEDGREDALMLGMELLY
jgi:ribosomal-protein-alanine N-acetyltransferase